MALDGDPKDILGRYPGWSLRRCKNVWRGTQYGGRCPAHQVELLKGRIDVMHFKDLSIVGQERRTAPVMEGNLAWEELFEACRNAGVEYAMVEQDDTYGQDPFDELRISHDNLLRAGMEF